MKNRILLENYYLPGDLECKIGTFVDHYNHCRYHGSLNNLTPAEVYTGRRQSILQRRQAIKCKTIEHRRLQHQHAAAQAMCKMGQSLRYQAGPPVPKLVTAHKLA